MAENTTVPYMAAYGNITRALNQIKTASVPDRFTQDFLATTLDMTGGGARPVISYLKRTGFLGSDGTPTELYKRFRNQAQSGTAAAEALRIGYAPLYKVNERIHDANDNVVKGVIVQVTGAEPDSGTVAAMVKSFKALKAFASFDGVEVDQETPDETGDGRGGEGGDTTAVGGIRLGYTINLNLPATSDIAVFNAIFKSLREHLIP